MARLNPGNEYVLGAIDRESLTKHVNVIGSQKQCGSVEGSHTKFKGKETFLQKAFSRLSVSGDGRVPCVAWRLKYFFKQL